MKKYLMHTHIALNTFSRWILLAALLACGSITLQGQAIDYGNAWYNPNVDYMRFKVAADGIYRVSAQQLVQSGFDTTGVDPAHLHLMYRGVEQFIHVENAGNGLWDYLEFFGRRNDGTMDTLLYVNAYSRLADGSMHPNPHISTFSDTSTYFFYADQLPGLRLQVPFFGSVPPPLVVESMMNTSLVEYHPNNGAIFRTDCGGTYDIFTALNPAWTFGEGYVGLNISPLNDLILQIPTPHALGNAPANLRLRMQSFNPWRQDYEISLNGQLLLMDTVSGFAVWEHDLACPFPMLGDTQTLRIHVTTQNGNTNDKQFLNLAAITYPSSTDLDGGETAIFPVNNPVDVYYKFRDIAPGNLAVAYDLLHQVRYNDTIHGDSLGMWIRGQNSLGLIYLSTDQNIAAPLIESGPNSHLSATSNVANMVVITSRELAPSAIAYENFRESSVDYPLTVKVVYTDEIYEEFGFGSPHPLAIKHFCKYALDQWAVNPDYFLLWGKGKADIRSGGVNHVPAYGEPISDNLYIGAFLRDSSARQFRPEAAIGRVPIQTNQQGLDYIEKINIHETGATAAWMRNGIFLSAGHDSTEYRPIINYMEEYGTYFQASPWMGRVAAYGWQDSVMIDSAAVPLATAINNGTSLLYFFGQYFQTNHISSPASYANVGRMPVLIGQWSSVTGFNQDTLTFAEKWVLEPLKGAIAAVAHSSAGYLTPCGNWGQYFTQFAFVDQPAASLGQLVSLTSDTLGIVYTDQVYLNHLLCMTLLGDPSIHFRTGSFEVWPGDGNDDLVANNQDLLSIGLAYGDTGAVRAGATLNWVGQNATPWDSSFVTGSNHAHADCNGDGQVNADDTLAIVQNYGYTHNKTHGFLMVSSDDPELAIECISDSLPDSSHVQLFVRLGTVLHPADSVYGIAWSISYDPMLVDSASVVVDFDSCWIGEKGQNMLTMVRHRHSMGLIDMAITRIDHQPVSGQGIISRIGIVIIDNISGKRPGDTTISLLTLSPGDAQLVNREGNPLPLQGINKLLWVIGLSPEPTLPEGQLLSVYPNPALAEIYLRTRSDSPCTATIYDLSGKLLLQQVFEASVHKYMDLKGLAPGAYLLKVENADGILQQKIVKMD